MAESQEKLDIHDLVKQWERVVGEGTEATKDGGEIYAFVARLMNALPQLAHAYVQRDDFARALEFISSNQSAFQTERQPGSEFDAEKLAEAYIAAARHLGWKPPRECD